MKFANILSQGVLDSPTRGYAHTRTTLETDAKTVSLWVDDDEVNEDFNVVIDGVTTLVQVGQLNVVTVPVANVVIRKFASEGKSNKLAVYKTVLISNWGDSGLNFDSGYFAFGAPATRHFVIQVNNTSTLSILDFTFFTSPDQITDTEHTAEFNSLGYGSLPTMPVSSSGVFTADYLVGDSAASGHRKYGRILITTPDTAEDNEFEVLAYYTEPIDPVVELTE